jgi:hypothetical protein
MELHEYKQKLLDNVVDPIVATELFSHHKNTVELVQLMKETIDIASKKIQEMESQYQKKGKSERRQYEDITILRQFLLELFTRVAKETKDDRKGKKYDYSDLASRCHLLKKKAISEGDSRTQLALAVLEGGFECKLSPEICSLFITINVGFHPEMEPKPEKILKCIEELKQFKQDENKIEWIDKISEEVLVQLEDLAAASAAAEAMSI